MKIRLHELELASKDPAESGRFYEGTLGLKLNHSVPGGLKVFGTGVPGVDFNTSNHRPGKTLVSFVTDDLGEWVRRIRAKGVQVPDPVPSHLGLLSVTLEDPDGHLVTLQGLTDESPGWLREQLGF